MFGNYHNMQAPGFQHNLPNNSGLVHQNYYEYNNLVPMFGLQNKYRSMPNAMKQLQQYVQQYQQYYQNANFVNSHNVGLVSDHRHHESLRSQFNMYSQVCSQNDEDVCDKCVWCRKYRFLKNYKPSIVRFVHRYFKVISAIFTVDANNCQWHASYESIPCVVTGLKLSLKRIVIQWQ